jgi:hypothetical protein
VIVAAHGTALRAVILPLSRSDIERALELARWPHTADERVRFHAPYVVAVDTPPIDHWAVEQVEVITEFRRLELMAEEHGRINDTWGRGGLRDVEEAMRRWRGRVSIVVRLGIRSDGLYVGGVPAVRVAIAGAMRVPSEDVRTTNVYATCGELSGCPLIGAVVEQVFDAADLRERTRSATVWVNDRPAARVALPFKQLD